MDYHIVSTKALQDIIDYLSTKPYTEVSGLIKNLADTAQSVTVKQPEEVQASSQEEELPLPDGTLS